MFTTRHGGNQYSFWSVCAQEWVSGTSKNESLLENTVIMVYMELMRLTWMPFGEGYLGKSHHGLYFVYRNLDPGTRLNRWFAQYEAGADKFGEQGKLINLHGFDTFEDARGSCEKHASEVKEML